MGALGIITSVTLQCVPAFNLKILEFTAKLPEIISRFKFEELSADFVEFFWFPHTELAEIKSATKTALTNTRTRKLSTFVTNEVTRNFGFSLLNQFCLQFPNSVDPMVNSVIKENVRPERIDASHKSFALNEELNFLKWSIQSQESVFSKRLKLSSVSLKNLAFQLHFLLKLEA